MVVTVYIYTITALKRSLRTNYPMCLDLGVVSAPFYRSFWEARPSLGGWLAGHYALGIRIDGCLGGWGVRWQD